MVLNTSLAIQWKDFRLLFSFLRFFHFNPLALPCHLDEQKTLKASHPGFEGFTMYEMLSQIQKKCKEWSRLSRNLMSCWENNSQAFGTFGNVHGKITDGSKLFHSNARDIVGRVLPGVPGAGLGSGEERARFGQNLEEWVRFPKGPRSWATVQQDKHCEQKQGSYKSQWAERKAWGDKEWGIASEDLFCFAFLILF